MSVDNCQYVPAVALSTAWVRIVTWQMNQYYSGQFVHPSTLHTVVVVVMHILSAGLTLRWLTIVWHHTTPTSTSTSKLKWNRHPCNFLGRSPLKFSWLPDTCGDSSDTGGHLWKCPPVSTLWTRSAHYYVHCHWSAHTAKCSHSIAATVRGK